MQWWFNCGKLNSYERLKAITSVFGYQMCVLRLSGQGELVSRTGSVLSECQLRLVYLKTSSGSSNVWNTKPSIPGALATRGA
jgi:hypothetical protein